MRINIHLTKNWYLEYDKYKHDLKTIEGIKSYVAACEAAAAIPPLTDKQFYKKILEDNADKFGSKNQLKERNN